MLTPKKLSAAEVELKTRAERIIPDLDDCEVKENNYYNDITKRGMSRSDIMDTGYREEYIEFCNLIYHYRRGDVSEKFTSEIYPTNTISLQSHILEGEIIVYIDRYDRGKYFFNFEPKASS